MEHIGVDEYVLDVLMRDLVGHDRSPAAFLVYLFLWSELYRAGEKRVAASLQRIADSTGLSKSAVQAALRVLKRRQLIAVWRAHQTAVPEYSVLRHWLQRRAKRRSAS